LRFIKDYQTKNSLQSRRDVDGHKLLVIDDCMAEGIDSTNLIKIVCISSHHNNIMVLFLVQNVFQKGKVMRTLSLNTHYFILFRNYRDQLHVEALGRQIFDLSPVAGPSHIQSPIPEPAQSSIARDFPIKSSAVTEVYIITYGTRRKY